MALTKQGNFSQQPSELPDVPSPSMTPDQIRAKWQTPLDELKTTINTAFDKLNSTTDGASGADNVGATGFDGTASTVQGLLENLNTNKATKGADWTGTWQGFNPSQVDQTLRDQVNTNKAQLANITVNLENFSMIAPEVDDNGKFQRAIDSIPNGGQILVVKPVTVANLVLQSGVRIVGVGFYEIGTGLDTTKGSVIKQREGSNGPLFLAKGDNTNFIYNNAFVNLAFWGNGKTVEAINTENMMKYTIENCYAEGFSVAVHIAKRANSTDGSYYGNIRNMAIKRCTTGYKIDGRSNVHTIIGGYVFHCDLGVDWQYSENILFLGTSFEGNGINDTVTPANNQPQIKLSNGAESPKIIACYMDASITDHILITDSSVKNSTILGNEYWGTASGFKNVNDLGGVGTLFLTPNAVDDSIIPTNLNLKSKQLINAILKGTTLFDSLNANYNNINTIYQLSGRPDKEFIISALASNMLRLNFNSGGDVIYYGGTTTQQMAMRSTGDFELLSNGKGVYLKSPNGTRYKLTVNDAGALIIVAG